MSKPNTESASLLNRGLPFEDQLIEGILRRVEENIRNVCYAMQLVQQDEFVLADLDRISSMLETFYEYVDAQMDTITNLRSHLSGNFSWLSINTLRESSDFRIKSMPREAFRSEDAYQAYLAKENGESAFNEYFGESVSPANKKGANHA